MKRMFKFLLWFESEDGSGNVAEFSSNADYLEFKEELEAQERPHKLVNEREFSALRYRGVNYIDMRD